MTFLTFSLCFKFLPRHFTTRISQFSRSCPLTCCVSQFLSSLSLFFFPSSTSASLWSVTHIARELTPCSSEICEYIGRNVCPSWHYNALYQLTRGVGGEWGRKRGGCWDVRGRFRSGGEKKKESSLWLLIWQDMKQPNGFGIWQNSFLQWVFTTRGIPWHEATYV